MRPRLSSGLPTLGLAFIMATLLLQGCAVVTTTASVAGAVVSTAVDVTTTAVGATADAAGAAVHMATSSNKQDSDRKDNDRDH